MVSLFSSFLFILLYFYYISLIFLFIHILFYYHYLWFILYFRDKRQPLDDIVQVSFPILQTLMTQLLDNNTLAAASVMRLCLKIFWSATIYHLPAAQGRHCIVLYCIVLYCIVLYCIVLYCIVLYCIVLYCIVLYFIVFYLSIVIFILFYSQPCIKSLITAFLCCSQNHQKWRIIFFVSKDNLHLYNFSSFIPYYILFFVNKFMFCVLHLLIVSDVIVGVDVVGWFSIIGHILQKV